MRNSYLIVILLLLLSAVYAENQVNITVTQSACSNSGDLIATIQNLPVCIAESIFNLIFSGLAFAVKMFMNASFALLLAVPDVHWFCGPYSTVMGIIESLYTLLIMGLGLYYIIRSTDVEGRLTAKRWLKNLFLMMIVLSFSFYIFDMILQVNNSIASTLLSQASTNFFSVQSGFSDLIFASIILMLFVMGGILSFFTLLIRYLMLPFLLLLFPFTIFFYFLPITEGFGRFMLKFTLLIVFMTSVDALLILGFFSVFNASDPTLMDGFIRAMAALAAFSSIGIVNLVIFVIALLMVVQQGLKLAGEAIAWAVRLAFLASML